MEGRTRRPRRVLPDGEEVLAPEGRNDPQSVLRELDAHLRRVQEVVDDSLRIARAPSRGPGTSTRNAQRHPTCPATAGSSRRLIIVSRKPAQVCSVKAVPT